MEPDRALTQDEIDALLEAMPPQPGASLPEPANDDRVRTYDFRAPDRFSKEQVRILQMIYSSFARHLSGALSAALRFGVQVSFVHIEQSTFDDFSQTLPESVITAILTMEPLPGRCLAQFDLEVVLAAIDRLLGGRGKPVKLEEDRELSDIELKLTSSLLRHVEHAMRESWVALLDLKPQVVDISTKSQMMHVALPSDAAVMVMFEMRIQDMAGMMCICLPYELLKPVAPRLTPQAWITAGSPDGNGRVRELVESQVERVPLTCMALLGTAELTVGDLVGLQVGDVIRLDSIVADEIPVLVEGEERFGAWPGLLRNRRAVKIARVLEEDTWL